MVPVWMGFWYHPHVTFSLVHIDIEIQNGQITVTIKFFYGELHVWMQLIGSLNYPRIALDSSNYVIHISWKFFNTILSPICFLLFFCK